MYRDLVDGNEEKARSSKEFYDEYGAVLDVFAGFYLDTVDRIFQRHLLAVGELTWRGERVDPSLIRRTALLTIEGERDQLCSPGQTDAAHGLCTSLPDSMRGRLLAADVGHYGVFSGSRWEADIYPVLRGFISEHATASV
jgi:polyhydroxyalkanoate depolymerase